MKSARTTLGINLFRLALLLSILCCLNRAHAQSPPDNTNMVLVTAMPTNGTFWSMQLTNFPPFPWDPYPDLPLYSDGSSANYYYDDLDVDYSAMRDRSRRSGGVTADDSPPSPGGGGGGGDGGGGSPFSPFIPPGPGYTNCETWSNFWIQISASSNVITIMISNTLPGMSYNLLGSTNLASPWSAIITDWAATNTFLTTNIDAGTNPTLFFVATLTTNDQPPVISIPPSNQVVFAGSNAVFSVTATGLDLAYQWQFNGTNLSGATNSTLTISEVETNNVGAYTVIVSNVICEASATAGLGLIWSDYLGAAIDASPAISADGTTFIATTGSVLFALNALGHTNWSTTNIVTGQDGLLTSSVALAADGSAVYIGTQDSGGGYLRAFNPTNGDLIWSTYLGAYVNSSPAVSASDGTIYVGVSYGSTNGLFSINPTSHDINWLFQTDDPDGAGESVVSSPCVGPDCTVYFLAPNDLYAVNSAGSVLWFFPVPAGSTPQGSPALDANSNILFGSSDGYVYCVNPSGGLQWLFDTGADSAIGSSIAVGADGLVVAATENGNLFGITNGVLAWQFTEQYGYPFVSSPAIGRDNVVVIGSEDSYVYGITNGGIAWSNQTGNYILSSPAINPLTGAVTIGSEDGYIYSLSGVAGPAIYAPWPMFHENPSHNGAAPNPTCLAEATNVAFPNNPYLYSGSGQFSFQLSGTLGSVWTVYASSDLMNWGPVGTVALDSSPGTGQFTDYGVGGLSNRFYEARSGSSCSPIIGFAYITLSPGTNLAANQFYQVNDSEWPQNSALGLLEFLENNGFPYPYLPNGVEILKWNGGGFETNTWSVAETRWESNGDITLLPGESDFIIDATNYPVTVPFAGLVSQGVWTTALVPGTNFISSILPLAGRIQSDLGYQPNNGDVVKEWNGGSLSTYSYSGGWYPSEPVVAAGQGFLLVAATNNIWPQTNLPCSGTFTLTPVWNYNVTNLDSNNFYTGYYPDGIIDASPAIGSNGLVIIQSTDNFLFALNPTNGDVVWSNSDFTNAFGDELTSSPTISADGSTIYFGTSAGYMVAVTNVLTGGTAYWSNFVGAPVYSSPALSPDGGLFVGTDDASDIGLYGGTGIWGFVSNGTVLSNFCDMATNLEDDVDSSPCIGADMTLYFLAEGNGSVPENLPPDFIALSTNGNVTWAFPLIGDQEDGAGVPASASPAVDTDGTIYVTGEGRYVQALNPDGSPKWAFDTASANSGGDDFELCQPVVGADDTVFVASDERLYAITNGYLKWAFPDPNVTSATINFWASPVIDSAGNVYLGDMSGNFYAIGSDGQLQGVIQVSSASIISSAVIGTNDVIYFASSDGAIHALGIPYGPSTNAPWPMFRQNARHTAYQPLGPTLAHACGAPFPFIEGNGLDGFGDFTFSFVGAPATIWTLYESTNFTSWSTDGTSITNSSGAGPQTSSFEVTNINLSNEFFSMTSNGCCSKAIGFIQVTLQPGTNLIADPLYQIDTSIVRDEAPNTLQTLFTSYTNAFDGVEVDEWNGQGFDAYTNSYNTWYLDGNYNGDGPLRPGQSALIINTNAYSISVSFVGLVRDGVDVGGTNYVTNYITSATNYLGSILPLAGGLSTDLKFPASRGDRVQLWTGGTNLTTFTYTNTCDGTNWVWCPSEPVLGLGQGFVLITTNINNAWVQSVSPCYGE